MSDRIVRKFDFLAQTDWLKSVDRANVLMDLSRPENSAEHSWHVALQAMTFGASDRAIQMLLVHDLVEIDVGDQPIHLDHDAAALAGAEAQAADRIFGLSPDRDRLMDLWQEFEAGASPDAIMARRMDHSQPLFQVLSAPRPLADHVVIVRNNMDGGRAARLRDEWPEMMAWAEAMLARKPLPGNDLSRRLRFLAEADALKSVLRANLLIDGSRRENSAEHSWHLALYALAGQAHGSPEIQAAEARAALRIFGLLPDAQAQEFLALWQEFEAAASPDAVFAKSLDRCQPVIQNLLSGGIGWVDYGVTFGDIEARVGLKIAQGAPDLWHWLRPRVQAFFA